MAVGASGLSIEPPEPVPYPGIYANMEPITQEVIAPQEPILGYTGQCVGYIRYATGKNFSGNAWEIIPNWDTPDIGIVVITTEGPGHVALITEIQGEELILSESNYYNDEQVTHGRKLNMNSNVIRGYYNLDI